MISKFNGTSTPKGSCSAKAGVNCRCKLSPLEKNVMVLQSKNCTVWEHSLSGQVWTKCPTRPDNRNHEIYIQEQHTIYLYKLDLDHLLIVTTSSSVCTGSHNLLHQHSIILTTSITNVTRVGKKRGTICDHISDIFFQQITKRTMSNLNKWTWNLFLIHTMFKTSI